MIEYSKTDYEHILNVVFYHRHLYVKSNTDKYIGYVEYDEDEKYYIFRPSRTATEHQRKKFEEHFKNATKLEKGIAIETLDFIEWFMCNLKNLEKHPFDGVLPYFNIDKVTEDESYTYDRTYTYDFKFRSDDSVATTAELNAYKSIKEEQCKPRSYIVPSNIGG